MWYFTWILGLLVAVLFAVVNAMWLEMREDNAHEAAIAPDKSESGLDK